MHLSRLESSRWASTSHATPQVVSRPSTQRTSAPRALYSHKTTPSVTRRASQISDSKFADTDTQDRKPGEGEATEGIMHQTHASDVDVKKVAETHTEGDQNDLERPRFHVMGRRGWTSDPCGPFHHKGWYHLFFQSIPDSADWVFGLCWGHVVSRNLVHWQHMPDALRPTEGGRDADGCFTGAAVVDKEGVPTILYTGVRLRNNPDAGPPPAKEDDLDLPFFESQLCAAHADPNDEHLKVWTKESGHVLEMPPDDMRPFKTLAGWRDPCIVDLPSEDNNQEYTMLVGNGVEEKGGCALMYKSQDLRKDWRYEGQFASSGTTDDGHMWELPLLIPLAESAQPPSADLTSDNSARTIEEVGGVSHPKTESGNGKQQPTHAFITSPDAPTNPAIYWLGTLENGKFPIEKAEGPFRLDIGNVAYAVNSMRDQQGRTLLWAWLKENGRLPEDEYSYSGCESSPRELSFQDGRIMQRPLPELALLRTDKFWMQRDRLPVECEKLLPFPATSLPAMDISFTLERGSATSAGLYIRSWRKGGHGSLAILFDWKARCMDALFDVYYLEPSSLQLKQEACPPDGLPEGEEPEGGSSPDNPEEERDENPEPRRAGGEIDIGEHDPIRLRVLLDGSVCEVFTSTGTVLTTRVNRGRAEPGGKCPDIGFFAVHGEAKVSHVEAYGMDSCWTEEKADAFDRTPCKSKRTKSASKIEDGDSYDPHAQDIEATVAAKRLPPGESSGPTMTCKEPQLADERKTLRNEQTQ
ncbi:hypothetical protein WJX73_008374 [Symbiochloris irregularis]|uniref:beta-fructofuranosidase n=1 Tax=Symbiochloris irregularis TaxID=706552 RepID=A0AAW1PWK7_9CHLO